jgi:hypothetical protein
VILTAELSETDASAGTPAHPRRAGPHRWTPEEARNAARLSRESRATRGKREPPSDAEIERGLRERAVSDPRAAETLIRWLQRPRAVDIEDNLSGLSLEELERLHEGLRALCSRGSEHVDRVLNALLNDEIPTETPL